VFATERIDLSEFIERVDRQQAAFIAEAARLKQAAKDGTLYTQCPEDPRACNGMILVNGVGTIDCPADPCPHAKARADFANACLLRACGFGEAEWYPTWERVPDDVRPVLQKYCETIQARRKQGTGLTIAGAVGCGKTCAAALTCIAAIHAGYEYAMVESAPLVTALSYLQRSGRHTDFDADQLDARDTLNTCNTADFLCIDDFGAENQQQLGYCWDLFSGIINHRYKFHLPTIITTNMTPEDWQARPDFERLLSRIASRNAVIRSTAGNQRSKVSAEEW